MSSTTYALNQTDQFRFNELMENTYKKVFNMAYRLAGNRPDAEDLTQEAFYRAYRSFSDYEGDKPFENWIFRIVTRLFLDMLRSRRRRIKAMSFDAPLQKDGSEESLYFDVPDQKPGPDNEFLNSSFSEDLQHTLNALSSEQRMLITLADIEGMPYKEIADIIGKPIGTIRSRLHRTHKMMRMRLEQIQRERRGSMQRQVPALSYSFMGS
jgi:RNA polymerase sigma-70 factor (ECF subfamily)